jgi:hypothetical protein
MAGPFLKVIEACRHSDDTHNILVVQRTWWPFGIRSLKLLRLFKHAERVYQTDSKIKTLK